MTSILDQETPPETPQVDPEKDYFSELVGEDKKYKTEKDLARAVMEKEAFIQRTTRENAELREDLQSSRATKRLEEQLDQLLQAQAQRPPSNDNNQHRESEPPKGPAITPEEIKKLIKEDRDYQQMVQNRDQVTKRLQETYGSNYVSKVKETASQLSVDPNYLDNLAVSNPQAFYRIMKMDEPRRQDDSILAPPRGGITSVPQSGSRKNWDYYEKMRKTKPTEYHSIQVQNEMHAEAQKQREDFYK
jgi:hypothetical protein